LSKRINLSKTQSQFQYRVYRAAEKIPRGKVTTYKAIARAIGNPLAVRAVGNALNKNPHSFVNPEPRQRTPKVPCHRVIKSDGSVGGFALGTRNKIKLLQKEGIIIKNGGINLKKFGWRCLFHPSTSLRVK